jgi:tetratricopeptide (TPR) repeat protein
MRSTGVRRSLAAFASCLALIVPATAQADDCALNALDAQATQRRVEELSQKAQRELVQQQFADALRDFKDASCLAPRDARLLYAMGSAQAATGDFLAARKSLTAANRLQPNTPLPLAMLVRVNFAMGDVDSLRAALLEAGSSFPRDANLHATLAQFLVQNKLFDLALAESLRSQKAGTADTSLLELAILENTVGAYDDAVKNATSVENQTNLTAAERAGAAGVAGLSYESLGKREAAIAHLRQALVLDPSQENSYLALAFLLEKTQRYAEAAAILEQSRQKLPGSTAILLPLGSDLILAEKYQPGVEVLQELLRKSPDEQEAYIKLADAFRKMNEFQQEIQILQALFRRNPSYPGIHLLRARAILNSDTPDLASALDELQQATESAPTDADIFYTRGKLYLTMNRNEDAMADLIHSIDLRPMDPAPYYQLGRVYEKLGKTQLAKETFARMQYLKSNDSGSSR